MVGVPNEEMGEEVKAVVQLAPGIDAERRRSRAELLAYAREHIAHYKCPRSIDFMASCRACRRASSTSGCSRTTTGATRLADRLKHQLHRHLIATVMLGAASIAVANDASDLEARARALTSVGACFAPTFSPDGKQIAFLSDMTGTPQVWVVPTAGGWPTKLTAFTDPVGSVAWSPTGEWLAYSVAPGGGMNSQVFLMRPDGTGNKKIAGGGEAVTWMGLWQPDGKTFTLSSNQRHAVAIDAYLYDVPTGEMKRVTEDAMGMNAVVEFTPDHSKALVLRMLDQYQAHPFLLDLATGARTELTHHENPGIWRGGGLAGDDTVYIHSNLDRDFVAFARIRIGRDGKPGPLEVIAGRDDADLEHFELTPDRSAAALLWNVAGQSELEIMDLRTNARTRVPLPSEAADALRFSRDGNLLAMVIGGSTVVPDIFVLDRRTGKLSQVTHSPHPGVDLATLVRPRSFASRRTTVSISPVGSTGRGE